MLQEVAVIAAGTAEAIPLSLGQHIKIIEAFGPQVVDTWAFNATNVQEFMSMAHTRSCNERLTPAVDDYLYTNFRRPILKLVEDTTSGIHDTLLSACDAERYRLLGSMSSYHSNCSDNLKTALDTLGCTLAVTPDPLNLFEHVTCSPNGKLRIEPPTVVSGDYVVLRAEMAIGVVLSACPMDMAPTNGSDMMRKAVQYQVT